MLGRSVIIRHYSLTGPNFFSPFKEQQVQFQRFLESFHSTLILTGAGVSTDSGIPDYRSEETGLFNRTSYKPIQYADFIKNADARKRYWARNYVAWPKFSSFTPNNVHYFIASLQVAKSNTKLITQNVDGLHSKAGSPNVLELHGNAYWVRCVSCQETMSRYSFQTILKNHNPNFDVTSTELRPDGDVHIPQDMVEDFKVPYCEKCQGILKPTIVFFGQSVPEKVAKTAESYVDECDSMLILGTSLSTLSSLRLVEKAYDDGKFICLINKGLTRGDNLADLNLKAKISDIFFNTPANEFK